MKKIVLLNLFFLCSINANLSYSKVDPRSEWAGLALISACPLAVAIWADKQAILNNKNSKIDKKDDYLDIKKLSSTIGIVTVSYFLNKLYERNPGTLKDFFLKNAISSIPACIIAVLTFGEK